MSRLSSSYKPKELSVFENLKSGSYTDWSRKRYDVVLVYEKPLFRWSLFPFRREFLHKISDVKSNQTNMIDDVVRQVRYWASRGVKIKISNKTEKFREIIENAIGEGSSWNTYKGTSEKPADNTDEIIEKNTARAVFLD